MPDILTRTYKTPFGELILGVHGGRLCLCDWRYRSMRGKVDERISAGLDAVIREGSDPLLDDTEAQLLEYFHGRRKDFDLPLVTVGTDFQKSVWNALREIGYGETETYAGLARRVSRPEAVRAVGSANGANAISIIIPCHRIVGSGGSLGGYAGGLTAKRKLLEIERQSILDLN
jgi:methylated-DNA-[protein]-cysteine S-methyltransferase